MLCGNWISLVFGSGGAFPSPSIKSCSENVAADASPVKWTLMFVVSVNVFTYLHALRHALSSSAGDDLWIMGNVWRKSPAKTTVEPPIKSLLLRRSCNVWCRASRGFLWAIVHSSQMMAVHCWRTLACPDPLDMSQTGWSPCAKFSGNLNADCAVLPPLRRVEAIPDEATASAIFFRWRIFAKSNRGWMLCPFRSGHQGKRYPLCFPLRDVG